MLLIKHERKITKNLFVSLFTGVSTELVGLSNAVGILTWANAPI